jgi:hypothetical protein
MRHCKYAAESCRHSSASACIPFSRRQATYFAFASEHSPKWSSGNDPLSGARGGRPRAGRDALLAMKRILSRSKKQTICETSFFPTAKHTHTITNLLLSQIDRDSVGDSCSVANSAVSCSVGSADACARPPPQRCLRLGVRVDYRTLCCNTPLKTSSCHSS